MTQKLEQSPHLKLALNKLVEICESMYAVGLKREGGLFSFDTADFSYGSSLSLICPGGSWELAFFGDAAGCQSFTRSVLMMEGEDELTDADVVDMLGETVNMVAGLIKRAVPQGSEISFAVPHSHVGNDCAKYASKSLPILVQAFGSDSIDGTICLVWSERNLETLLGETLSWLNDEDPLAKRTQSRVLALLEEMIEAVADNDGDDHLDQCVAVVMAAINEESADPAAAMQSVVGTLAAILHNSGRGLDEEAMEVPAPDAHVSAAMPVALAVTRVERDEETIEALSEFIEESTEGLDSVDEILMAAEGGRQDPEQVNALFRTFHSIKGLSSFYDLHDTTRLAHTTETLMGKVRDGECALEGTVLDAVFDSAAMMRQLVVEMLPHAVECSESVPLLPTVPPQLDRLEALIAGKEVVPDSVASTAVVETPGAEVTPAKKKLKETIKVEVEQLNRLDELITEFSGSAAKLLEHDDLELSSECRDLGQGLILAGEGLRELSVEFRMVTADGTFKKMSRMVRDLSKKTEKMMRVVVDGEDTRIPRNFVEKLGDPLVHMIRNAVDHGIEAADERSVSSKQPLATIRLAALRENGSLVIEVADDGRGIDADKVLARAVSKEVVPADAELGESEIYQLLFAPGFSTAEQVTSLSGRGVGMDVVKRNIEDLGGQIDITSRLGAGSTFRIVLPLK